MQKALCKKRCAWKHVSVSAIAQHASSMYIHIYVYIYICVYICIFTYVYIDTYPSKSYSVCPPNNLGL